MADKISNARKKELEQPDPFLESLYKGMALAKVYRKSLVWVACAVVAIFLIVSGTVYSIRSSDKKAAALFTRALERYSVMTPVEGYNAVQEDMERLISEYPNTSAGEMGRIRFAEICYDAGEFEKARILYEGLLAEFPHDPVMTNLIRVALGHTCQMLEKDDRAVALFKAVVQGENNFLKDEALFNLGLLAEKAGEDDQSADYFHQIVSEHPQSIYRELVRSRVGSATT